jgi:hypothetical protein
MTINRSPNQKTMPRGIPRRILVRTVRPGAEIVVASGWTTSQKAKPPARRAREQKMENQPLATWQTGQNGRA